MISRSALATCSLGLLLLSGCGGGDTETGTTSSSSSTKAQFIAAGDSVCHDVRQRRTTIPEPEKKADVVPYVKAFLDVSRSARDDFAKIDPPADGTSAKVSLLAAMTTAASTLEQALPAARDGDLKTADDLFHRAESEAQAADAVARTYGFKACGVTKRRIIRVNFSAFA